MANPKKEIRELLLSLFIDTQDLRIFVEDYYSDLVHGISFGQAMIHVARDTAAQLVARGHLTKELFDNLVAERPAREG